MYWIIVILVLLADILLSANNPYAIYAILIYGFVFTLGIAVFLDNDQSEFFKQVKEFLFVFCFFCGLVKVASLAGLSYMAMILGG